MALAKVRQSFTVTSTPGAYAAERLTVGVPDAGDAEQQFYELMLNVETGSVGNAIAEIWLPKIGATGVDADYTYSGWAITGVGAQFRPLAGYPGFQVRVKSVGSAGTTVVDATAA